VPPVTAALENNLEMGKKSRRVKKNKAPTPKQNGQQAQAAQPYARAPQPGNYPRPFDTPAEYMTFPFVTEILISTILERGGVPQHLNTFETLQAYLQKVFTAPTDLADFFQFLATALMEGPPLINQPIQDPDTMMPLLHWVSHYKFFNARMGCNFTDDIVCLVLKAGADPNGIRPDNQTSALFFAVKYASLKAVDMLLEAGANIHHHDNFGRTCLINALQYPNPAILRRLLEHLPATEMDQFTLQRTGGNLVFPASAADMLLNYVWGDPSPIPWLIMGAPAVDDICEALILLLQKGGRLTAQGSEMSIESIGLSISNPNHPQLRNPGMLRKLAETLVGTTVPDSCKPKHEEELQRSFPLDEGPHECSICLDNVKKGITLYCGHTYCRECILEHGKQRTGCPMCRAQLCPEIAVNSGTLVQNIMGVDVHAFQRRGPRFLTNEQVTAEAKAQGIHNNFSSCATLRDKLQTEMIDGIQSSQEMKPIPLNNVRDRRGGASRNVCGHGRTTLELASNRCLVGGTPTNNVSICPSKGMANIEVTINGIPLLARISNQSLLSVFSKTMVEQLGLKRIETLQSKEFADRNGEKLKNSTMTCLEPIKICFEGIEVTLRNAVEIAPDPEELMTTVQLGEDFLYSGCLSVIDVEVGEEGKYYRVVGEEAWPTENVSRESFRYYTHNGKMADLPVIHLDVIKGPGKGAILTISLRNQVKFNQCHWCCRGFPEGMMECQACKGCYYCDERCQEAAWKIHKLTCKKKASS